ncbi:MAG: glycosyltransferase family 2 protein [Candidatus Hydrogenedentes bacterium]|nr:glycosyltransferase family 2 protein [Candidatus Hydrogenedentota bacterium]
MISGIILVQDEELRLGQVLDQMVKVTDEVIVVDGGSVDSTAELARSYDTVQFFERPFTGDFASQSNFALDKARGSWILQMCPDELLAPSFEKWIPQLVKIPYVRHFRFPRYWLVEKDGEYFYCKSPKHYPDYQRRLFRNRPNMRFADMKPHSELPKKERGYGPKIPAVHVYHYCLLQSQDKLLKTIEFYTEVEGKTNPVNDVYLWEEKGVELVPVPGPLPGLLDMG